MWEDKKILAMLEEAIRLLHESIRLQFKILKHLQPQDILAFTISQQGENSMPLLPIAPGFSPQFTATPVPSTSVPAPGQPLTWTSSDTTNFPITFSGLVATAAIPTTATVGTTGTLTISYTNADNTVATGSFSWTIVAAPATDITSFTVAQTV